MGRRSAGGRKYPKHISIQVLDQHNDDLKLITSALNETAVFPGENKKWTIRDVLLTLVYGFCKEGIDSSWFMKNHFEKFTPKQLEKFRSQIEKKLENKKLEDSKERGIDRLSHETDSSISHQKSKNEINDIQRISEDKKLFQINPEIENFLEHVDSLARESRENLNESR